jgi:hypothetical protein
VVNTNNVIPRAHRAITAGSTVFESHGPNAIQTYSLSVYDKQYISPEPVPEADLVAAGGQRFVVPSETERWKAAQVALRHNGLVVLLGPVGSGRRTAALRLLKLTLPPGSSLSYLEPNWSEPKTRYLPQQSGRGAVLDMSFPAPGSPDESFGRHLVEYGRTCRSHGQFTVILTTAEVWTDKLAEQTQALTFRFAPPDAGALIAQDLRLHGLLDREKWLSTEESLLPDILESQPSPSEALRLSQIIRDADTLESLKEPLQEFTGWRTHIEDILLYPPVGNDFPNVLTTRTVLWSAALLDGAPARSVIVCSDLLLRLLKVPREPADIASDATRPKKLQAAHVSLRGNHVVLDDRRHGLDMAVLSHLFQQFSGLHDVLLDWVSDLLGDTSVPKADVERAVTRLVTLAGDLTDAQLLKAVASGLPSIRRPLAVQALTTAALSPKHGAYVRNQLYRWVKGKPNDVLLALVAEVCGGKLGLQRPNIALTRLCLIAENASEDCTELTKALSQLAETHPTEVIKAVHTWLDDTELRNAGRRAFLALANSAQGRTLILGENGERLNAPEERARLVRVWRIAVKDQDLDSPVGRALLKWGELMDSGDLPSGTDYLLAEVLEPSLSLLAMELFGAPTPAWQRVRTAAMVIRESKKSAGAVE